jgi:hypothetical protein
MTATNYLEQKIVDHILRNTAYPQPTGLYMALHTADPGEGGTTSEVTGGSYTPQAIAFAAAASPSGQAVSSATVTFTAMPGVTVTHFSIRENSVAGNPLFVGPLATPQTVAPGGNLQFTAGQVAVTCD